MADGNRGNDGCDRTALLANRQKFLLHLDTTVHRQLPLQQYDDLDALYTEDNKNA